MVRSSFHRSAGSAARCARRAPRNATGSASGLAAAPRRRAGIVCRNAAPCSKLWRRIPLARRDHITQTEFDLAVAMEHMNNCPPTRDASTTCWGLLWSGPLGNRVAATLAVVSGLLLVLANIMAASPHFHKFIHSDAATPGHVCLATLIGQQQIIGMDSAAVMVCPALALLFILPTLPPLVLAAPHYRFSPSRAPPAFFTSLVR